MHKILELSYTFPIHLCYSMETEHNENLLNDKKFFFSKSRKIRKSTSRKKIITKMQMYTVIKIVVNFQGTLHMNEQKWIAQWRSDIWMLC